jgi:hypothetical protein
MVSLRSAYTYLLGTAHNELSTIAESLNVARYTSDEQPFLVSGKPLPQGILTGEPSAK